MLTQNLSIVVDFSIMAEDTNGWIATHVNFSGLICLHLRFFFFGFKFVFYYILFVCDKPNLNPLIIELFFDTINQVEKF